ncbi:MAG: tRNA pseudouridine(55) synthase TruB [Ruminococcaceae bacterium]|nr:tRNA pseudouridine(55) synthase TruB [Oscillospiraceae bacterium]
MDELCGILYIDKPCGMTSHDVVNRIRRLYGTKRVGHTGTLDPLATGLLTVMIGRAAKVAELLVSDKKSYRATLRLGLTTDSGDITGNVLTESDAIPSEEAFRAVLPSFTGVIRQIPPMYSALKVDGQKLVDLARKGIEIERSAREIEIDGLSAEKIDEKHYTLDVSCSKGTYIRTLCEDIGQALGCGATMTALRRTSSGSATLSRAYTLEQLEGMEMEERILLLLPVEELFGDCPSVCLPPFFEHLARNGLEIYQKKIGTHIEDGELVRLCGEKGFFALGRVKEYAEGSAIKPVKQIDIG